MALSGMATELDLYAEPSVVAFGEVRLGEIGSRSLLLGNRGATEVRIEQAGLTRSSSDRFAVLSPSVGTLLPGLPISVGFEFRPVTLGRHRGQVEFWVAGEPEPFLVDLEGTGTGEPCAASCPSPVAACPSAQTVLVASTALLEGSGAHPDDAPLHCAWRVVAAPDGSRTVPVAAAGSCAATLTPELVGAYTLALTVTDPRGASDTCTTRVTARAPGGLWVELVWGLPGDVDLHLLHPSGGPAHERSSWSRAPFDCYFGNMRPSWDLPGPRDDPRLDRDDVAQVGAENIQILEPSLDHPYSVGFAWFANHFNHPEMRATAAVYCAGELAARETVTLSEVGELVVIGEVQFTAPSRCPFRPDGTHLPPVR
ncbi:MAG: Ig-like domain-containing protein [Myxococcales bacterium]